MSSVRTLAGRANGFVARRTGFALTRVCRITELDRELKLLIAGCQIDHILDVGAHTGEFGTRVRRDTMFSGQLTSFEPSPSAFAGLNDQAGRDTRWTAWNCALGSADGQAEFTEYGGDGQLNSLRSLGAHANVYQPGISTVRKYPVEVRRLDGMWVDLEAAGPTILLKTDTQGFDLEVIRGVGQFIERVPVVLMEVAVKPLYEGAPVVHEVMAEMNALGFELTGAFPIHRYAAGIRVIEFDCTFVNTRLA